MSQQHQSGRAHGRCRNKGPLMHHSLFLDPGGSNLTFCLLFRHGENGSGDMLTADPPPAHPITTITKSTNTMDGCLSSIDVVCIYIYIVSVKKIHLNKLKIDILSPIFQIQTAFYWNYWDGFFLLLLTHNRVRKTDNNLSSYSFSCCYEGNHVCFKRKIFKEKKSALIAHSAAYSFILFC